MFIRPLVLGGVLFASVSGTALAADPVQGFYVGLGAGASLINNPTYTSPVYGSGTLSYDTGFAGSVSAGFHWLDNFRSEAEFGYLGNSPTGGGGNDLRAFSYMFNTLYDFNQVNLGGFVPHIGGGIGVSTIVPSGGGEHVNPLTYQAIGGVEYALPMAPAIKLGVDYRWVGTEDVTDKSYGAPIHYDLRYNSVLATIRYDFGTAPAAAPAPAPTPVVAPPPPPPPPVIEKARHFQVFFDFDKSEITAAAARVIADAAASVKAGHLTHITVVGHTDTVGSVQYNQGLSERRASAVATELVHDGVASGEIMTKGVGKTDLLVPTKDGVREAQNRRATIDVQ
jgi:outer membrane protein OmpA-like peptidoglycan-associated protein